MLFEHGYENAIALIEKLNDPWGIKDQNSQHIYMNSHARKYTNTPDNYALEGKLDVEFPAAWHELHEEFIKHDQVAIKNQCNVSVMEVHHWYGKSSPVAFICNKFPIYNLHGECIGIIWNAIPASILNPALNHLIKNNINISSHSIKNITEKEHEIIWLILHGYTRKEISSILNISLRTVKSRLYSVFEKESIFNIKQLRLLYMNNHIESHIPPSLLKKGLFFL